jgi:hypothetical protein
MIKISLDQVFAENGILKFSDIPEPFGYTTVLWDIPNTLIGMINSMPAMCKKLTMARGHSLQDLERIESAARMQGIEIAWVPVPSLENIN